MGDRHSQKIDNLLAEANDCELIGHLATTPEVRKANRRRATELRKLAEEALREERVAGPVPAEEQ